APSLPPSSASSTIPAVAAPNGRWISSSRASSSGSSSASSPRCSPWACPPRGPAGAHETANGGGRVETVSRGRLVKTGTLSAGILLILALLAIVNYFSSKYYKRFDWTGSHIYTLSPKSREVLRQLHQDVDVVMLMPPEQNVFEPTRELLQRYA